MANPASLLPADSTAHASLEAATAEARCVVFCGIPGVGKSLMLREAVGFARRAGRPVRLLQWDVARQAFELPEILARYPEVGGSTHVAIRRAVGRWAREALSDWASRPPRDGSLLLVEAPLVGGRLVELAHREADGAEALLADAATRFFVPVPTRAVRTAIEAARRAEMQRHRHARDAANANAELVDALWMLVAATADQLGIESDPSGPGYSPERYYEVYRRVLRHRAVEALPIGTVLAVEGSPHALGDAVAELEPEASEALRLIEAVEAEGLEAVAARCERWFET